MRLFYRLCQLVQEQKGVLEPPELPLATPLYKADFYTGLVYIVAVSKTRNSVNSQ